VHNCTGRREEEVRREKERRGEERRREEEEMRRGQERERPREREAYIELWTWRPYGMTAAVLDKRCSRA
jgi:hypothetical protein